MSNLKEKIREELVIDEESYELGQEHKEKEFINELQELMESNKPFKDEFEFLKSYYLVPKGKMEQLARIWCLMNDRQIDSGEAAIQIRDLFTDLVLDYWNNQY